MTTTIQTQNRRLKSFPSARDVPGGMKGIGDADLTAYLKDVRDIDLLTPEEEQRLARRIQAGDLEARSHFIAANLRLVTSIARTYQCPGVELPDLIQEGNLGLIRAVDKFDLTRGRFSTYAHWWIHQAVSRAVEERSGVLRLPNYAHTELGQIRRYQKRYIQTTEREPRIEEIAQETGIEVERVHELMRAVHPVASLDAAHYGEDSDQTLSDILPDTQAEPVEDVAARAADGSAIERALRDLLLPRECEIIRLRYGFGGPSHTLEQVGRELHLSRTRVSQIETGALTKLRTAFATSLLEGGLPL